MAKLEVQIGADISELKAELSAAEAKLDRLRKQKAVNLKLGVDNTVLDSKIAQAKQSLLSLDKALNTTGNNIQNNFSKKVANGGNTLTQFSRIAQDAPFGIIGIGNNITATAESFGYLSKSAGGATGAFKAIGQSLLGTGGVLLAVSLVTSAFTYLSQNGLTVGDVINKLTGNFDEFKKALSDANAEAVKNASSEISGMNALVSAAKNVNLSMEDRLIAVNKLQKEYPGYFGNLSQEQILNGNVAKAVAGVTAALIAKAKAQAFTKNLVKLAEEQYKLEEKREELIAKRLKAQNGLSDKESAFANSFGKNQDYTYSAVKRTYDAVDDLDKQLKDNEKQTIANASAQAKWTEKINENVAASIKLDTQVQKTKTPTFAKDTPEVNGLVSALTPAPLVIAPSIDLSTLKANISGLQAVTGKALTELELALIDFNENVNKLINDSFINTFVNLGQTIGDALASGKDVLDAVGATLLQSLGGLLSAIGTELIKLGTAAVLAGTVVQLFGSITGIGAGLAAIAGGVALNAVGAAMGQQANKNISNGNKSSGSDSNTNYASSSGGYGGGGGFGNSVVFEISGQSLIGVLSNTLDNNRRLGGKLGI